MKTLYLTQSSDNIVVDPETNFVGRIYGEDRYSIRNVYYIEEPMHVVYQNGEEKEEIDARKGDILLVFYSDRFNLYHIDTIRSKQWSSNIKNTHKITQQEKEEWALKNANIDNCKCDCENTCAPAAETFSTEVTKVTKKAKKVSKKTTKK